MAILKTTIAIRDAAFAENTAVMRRWPKTSTPRFSRSSRGGGRPATAMSHAASYGHATVCALCSIPALA